MVFFTPKPSLREASCCRVDVVKGGTGLRRTSPRSTAATRKAPLRIRPAASSATASVPSASLSSAVPSRRTSRAVKLPRSAMTLASTVQYSRGTKASISASRSQISRSATDCTRPAERLPGSFRQSTADRLKPTR